MSSIVATVEQRRWLRSASLLLLVFSMLGAGKSEEKKRRESDFWANLARPGHKRFVAALERGKKLYSSASQMRVRQLWRKTMEDALAAFQRATKASPEEALGHYWVGRTLYELDRMKPAIKAFKRARRLDPMFPRDYTISFSLGIAYSKLGRFAEAVQQYDRAERMLARSDQSSRAQMSRATLHGNAAEALMALGRLDEAIQRYREAVNLHSGYVLAWWGLAVALDRDEQVSKAMAAVQRVLSNDSKMQRLKDPGVFFIPKGDINYYYGLGHLARGDRTKAREHFERFVRELPNSPWAFRARDHLTELSGSQPAPRKGKRLAPFPQGEPAASSDASSRARSSIRYRISSRATMIRSCYQRALRKKKDLRGQMRVSFVVTKKGRAQQVRLLSSTMRQPALHACVLKVIRDTRFGQLGATQPVKIIYPFDFRPQ